jgi:hypothetical protein
MGGREKHKALVQLLRKTGNRPVFQDGFRAILSLNEVFGVPGAIRTLDPLRRNERFKFQGFLIFLRLA